jgi:hypothetical protein
MVKPICFSMLIALFFCSGTTARAFPIRTLSAGYLFEGTHSYLSLRNADDSRGIFDSESTNATTASFSRALVYFLANEMKVSTAFPMLSINSKWAFQSGSWFSPSLRFGYVADADTASDRLPLDDRLKFDSFLFVASAPASDPFSIWAGTNAFVGKRVGDGEEAEHRQSNSTSTATKAKVLPDVNKRPLPQTKDRYHEVRRGETLYRIAKKYGISVQELCRLNDINSNKIIQPNQKLLVSSEKNQ